MELRPIEFIVWEQLHALRWTLALAESCSGGLVSHRLTNVPGASQVFLGGVVAYSNAAKVHLLGVSEATLEQFGAVSGQTVSEMAMGAQKRFGAQTAIAVSGVAGPGGGSPQKPVGTVWIGVAIADTVTPHEFRFCGTREQIKQQSAEAALWLLGERLLSAAGDTAARLRLGAYRPVAVEFSGEGVDSLRIRSLYWRGQRVGIESVGRRWEDARGSHFLALSSQGKVYELLRRADGCWFLRLPGEALEFA